MNSLSSYVEVAVLIIGKGFYRLRDVILAVSYKLLRIFVKTP